jgi:hypothetical protein
MKTIIAMIMLCAGVALAQVTLTGNANLTGNVAVRFGAVAVGGGGVAGPPGVLVTRTNMGLAVSSLSTNINVTGNNTALLFFADWYDAAATVNTPTWNGSSTGVTLWTNANWLDASAKFAIYYLLSPAAGSNAAAISWSVATVDEAVFTAVVLTNCSGFETSVGTNYTGGGLTLSNIVTSATKDLMIAYGVVANAVETATPFTGQTVIASANPGANTHQNAITTKTGTAGTSTNGITWSGGSPDGLIVGGAIGY